jgi:hypothetical protein
VQKATTTKLPPQSDESAEEDEEDGTSRKQKEGGGPGTNAKYADLSMDEDAQHVTTQDSKGKRKKAGGKIKGAKSAKGDGDEEDEEEEEGARRRKKQRRTQKKNIESDEEDHEDEDDDETHQEGGETTSQRRGKGGDTRENVMTREQEVAIVEFYQSHEEFYNQQLQGFKERQKKDALLDDLGARIGSTGELVIFILINHKFTYSSTRTAGRSFIAAMFHNLFIPGAGSRIGPQAKNYS